MIYLLLLLLTRLVSIHSNPLNSTGSNLCQLNGYFIPNNGYTWAKYDNGIVCTCPDARYEINKPCRICQRNDICGPQSALCSEELINLSSTSARFICFCSSGLYQIGQKCPQDITTTTTTRSSTTIIRPTDTTIILTTTTTTSSTDKITTTTTTVDPKETTPVTLLATTSTTTTTTTLCDTRSSSSYLFENIWLILLFNLVYFVNK